MTMLRRGFLALFAACAGVAQVDAPRIGFIRTSEGEVRPLLGVAGNFSVGPVSFTQADAIWFDGRRGIVFTDGERITFDGTGKTLRRVPSQQAAEPNPGVRGDGDEAVIESSGVRLRLPFEIQSIERVGAEYVCVRGKRSVRLLRTTAGREAIYELPEAAR